MSQNNFDTIKRDFGVLMRYCGTVSDSFSDVTNCLYTVLTNWLALLHQSAAQDKTGPTNINYSGVDLNNPRHEYKLINPMLDDSVDKIKEAGTSYLLLSVILQGLTERPTKNYSNLQKFVNMVFDKLVSDLNSPRTASMVLLTLNSIALIESDNLLKRAFDFQSKLIADAVGSTQELINKLIDQYPNVRNGQRVIPSISQSGGADDDETSSESDNEDETSSESEQYGGSDSDESGMRISKKNKRKKNKSNKNRKK